MDAAVIGVLGTLAGAVVGLIGAAKLSTAERREARRVEKQQAFARYLGALYSAVGELRELPPDGPGTIVYDLAERIRGKAATFEQTRKRLAAMGNQHVERIDRLNAAIAQIQVLAMPSEIVDIVNDANEYVRRLGDERSDEIKAEWPALFERLHRAGETLDVDEKSWRRK
jgi:gas vesicle protein